MRRLALAHAIVLAVSCADAAPESSAHSDAGRAGAGDSPASGVTLSGSLGGLGDALALGATGPLLGDAKVCEDNSGTCTVTSADGWFALDGLPPETDILLVYEKGGYLPTIQAMESPRWSTGIATPGLAHPDYQRDAFNMQLRAAGLPELAAWEEVAAISFAAIVGTSYQLEPGVQVTLDPPSGSGPFYVYSDNSSSLDPPSDTAAQFGIFFNVEPREEGYELVYSYAGGECARYANTFGGWQPRSGRVNALRVPARAGSPTYPYAAYCWTHRDQAAEP